MKKLLLSLLLIPFFSSAEEKRIRIAIVDTGINESRLSYDNLGFNYKTYLCKDGHKDVTGYGLADVNGHGTNIAAIIAKAIDPRKYCLNIIKWFHNKEAIPQCKESGDRYRGVRLDCTAQNLYYKEVVVKSIKAAIDSGAMFINMSTADGAFEQEEYDAIKKAVARGIKFSIAAGNRRSNMAISCNSYPACYPIKSKNFRVIANCTKNYDLNPDGICTPTGIFHPYSNYGGPVTDAEFGERIEAGGEVLTGTSQSTAIFMGKWVAGKVK